VTARRHTNPGRYIDGIILTPKAAPGPSEPYAQNHAEDEECKVSRIRVPVESVALISFRSAEVNRAALSFSRRAAKKTNGWAFWTTAALHTIKRGVNDTRWDNRAAALTWKCVSGVIHQPVQEPPTTAATKHCNKDTTDHAFGTKSAAGGRGRRVRRGRHDTAPLQYRTAYERYGLRKAVTWARDSLFPREQFAVGAAQTISPEKLAGAESSTFIRPVLDVIRARSFF